MSALSPSYADGRGLRSGASSPRSPQSTRYYCLDDNMIAEPVQEQEAVDGGLAAETTWERERRSLEQSKVKFLRAVQEQHKVDEDVRSLLKRLSELPGGADEAGLGARSPKRSSGGARRGEESPTSSASTCGGTGLSTFSSSTDSTSPGSFRGGPCERLHGIAGDAGAVDLVACGSSDGEHSHGGGRPQRETALEQLSKAGLNVCAKTPPRSSRSLRSPTKDTRGPAVEATFATPDAASTPDTDASYIFDELDSACAPSLARSASAPCPLARGLEACWEAGNSPGDHSPSPPVVEADVQDPSPVCSSVTPGCPPFQPAERRSRRLPKIQMPTAPAGEDAGHEAHAQEKAPAKKKQWVPGSNWAPMWSPRDAFGSQPPLSAQRGISSSSFAQRCAESVTASQYHQARAAAPGNDSVEPSAQGYEEAADVSPTHEVGLSYVPGDSSLAARSRAAQMFADDPWKGWMPVAACDGTFYYHHEALGISQWHMPRDLVDVLGEWTPAVDEGGNTYWWNSLLGASCWRDPRGTASIFQAAYDGDLFSAQLYASAGGALDLVDDTGRSAVHYASSSGSLEVLSFLLQLGADASQPDGVGDTPLHLAAELGNIEVIKLLVQAQASPLQRSWNRGSRTPAEVASASGFFEAAQLLQGHEAHWKGVQHGEAAAAPTWRSRGRPPSVELDAADFATPAVPAHPASAAEPLSPVRIVALMARPLWRWLATRVLTVDDSRTKCWERGCGRPSLDAERRSFFECSSDRGDGTPSPLARLTSSIRRRAFGSSPQVTPADETPSTDELCAEADAAVLGP